MKRLVILGIALLYSAPCVAAVCSNDRPTCAEMGFTITVSACEKYNAIKCPWNTNALLCDADVVVSPAGAESVNCSDAVRDCTALGYTATKEDCKFYTYLPCPFDDTKVFCGGFKTVECTAGKLLFSDMRCYDDEDYVRTSGNLNVVGVMFTDTLAVSIQQFDSKRYGTCNNSFNTSTGSLKNCSSVSCGGACVYSGTKIVVKIRCCDFGYSYEGYNGKLVDTAKAQALANTSDGTDGCPKGYIATNSLLDNEYMQWVEGASSCVNEINPKGYWFLPTLGDLQLIKNNLTTINNKLTSLGASQISGKYMSTDYVSIDYGERMTPGYDFYQLDMSNGDMFYNVNGTDTTAVYNQIRSSVRCITNVKGIQKPTPDNPTNTCF